MPFIQKTLYSASNVDTDHNVYVPVICSYNTSGDCRPIYFSYDEDGTTNKIKIDKIEYSEKNSIFGYIYHCQVIINDHTKQIKLYFFKDLNKWSLRF